MREDRRVLRAERGKFLVTVESSPVQGNVELELELELELEIMIIGESS